MHGKTTTTSMVAAVLAVAARSYCCGWRRVDAMGSNARLGKSTISLRKPTKATGRSQAVAYSLVVTNIDREHMDCYRDMQDVEETFVEFMNRCPFTAR